MLQHEMIGNTISPFKLASLRVIVVATKRNESKN
jgi:hypothetical protein